MSFMTIRTLLGGIQQSEGDLPRCKAAGAACEIRHPCRIADYAATAGARLKGTVDGSGSQPGDPLRAAEAMVRITEIDHPPRHLVLGAFGVLTVVRKLQATLAEIEAWRDTGVATDFPKG